MSCGLVEFGTGGRPRAAVAGEEDGGWAATAVHYATCELDLWRLYEQTGQAQPRAEPGGRCQTRRMAAERFLQLADVADILNISASQTYALVRSGELPAIKIGGRGQWRVEATELEAYIQRAYADTKTFIDEHPFEDADVEE